MDKKIKTMMKEAKRGKIIPSFRLGDYLLTFTEHGCLLAKMDRWGIWCHVALCDSFKDIVRVVLGAQS